MTSASTSEGASASLLLRRAGRVEQELEERMLAGYQQQIAGLAKDLAVGFKRLQEGVKVVVLAVGLVADAVGIGVGFFSINSALAWAVARVISAFFSAVLRISRAF